MKSIVYFLPNLLAAIFGCNEHDRKAWNHVLTIVALFLGIFFLGYYFKELWAFVRMYIVADVADWLETKGLIWFWSLLPLAIYMWKNSTKDSFTTDQTKKLEADLKKAKEENK